jgi:hypothetical protein
MIKVNLVGFKEFQTTMKKLPTELKKEVGTRVRSSAEQFRDLAIKDAPADVGILRALITVKPIDELTYEVVSGSEYSAPMEFGTKTKFIPIPGIDSSEFKGKPTGGTWLKFIQNINNWTKRKGITGKSAPFLIARSIVKFGVRPHPFFFRQIPIVRRDFFRKFRNILKDVQ